MTNMETIGELPRYRSYKTVHALRIAAIEFNQDGSAKVAPFEDGYATMTTAPGYRDRFKGGEHDLGFFVVYEDGYQSWSPTKAFEEGYRLES